MIGLTAWGKTHDKNRSLGKKRRKIQLMSTKEVDVDRINMDFFNIRDLKHLFKIN